MPVSGIVSPAWTLIPMADHPTFPQSHAASCPLWDWTSWMGNKRALSAAHSTSYDVCRFFNLTMPVKPKQDPEQRTHPKKWRDFLLFHTCHVVQWQIFHTLSLTDINSLACETARWDQTGSQSGETGPKQWRRLKSQKMWFHRCANVYLNCRKTCMTVSTLINSWLCNTSLHLNPTNSSGFHFCASTSRICLCNCPWCVPLESR